MTLPARQLAVVPDVVERTPDEWAELIRGSMHKTVQAIMKTGRYLIEAKADVPHGQWLPMLEKVGIGASMAGRLMHIASNSVIANSANSPNLPVSWDTLHTLSRLDPAVLKAAIVNGTVTSSTRGEDAKLLLQQHKPYKPPKNEGDNTEEDEEPQGKPAIAKRSTQKHQLNTLERAADEMAGIALVLEAMFDGGFQETCTVEIRARYGAEIKDSATRIKTLITKKILPKGVQ